MRGGGGTTSGRLFEVLLAWGTGVLAATVVASLRLVMPGGGGRPDAEALRQTLWIIAMACVPFGFCVVLPFAFRVGNLLAPRRAWWYFLSFGLAAGLSWVATRWMFGGLRSTPGELAAMLAVLLVAGPTTAWALRARLGGAWAIEQPAPGPVRGLVSMMLAMGLAAGVTVGWFYAKWAALSIVDGDFELPRRLVLARTSWLGMTLAAGVGAGLCALFLRGHGRRERGWTLLRVGIACALAMVAAPFVQYLIDYVLGPRQLGGRAAPDPQIRYGVGMSLRRLLTLAPAFFLLHLLSCPPVALVRGDRIPLSPVSPEDVGGARRGGKQAKAGKAAKAKPSLRDAMRGR